MTLTDIIDEINLNISGLRDAQVPHAKTLIQSINIRGYALDTSTMGTGKTYSAGAIARHMDTPIFVLCPKVVRRNWERVLTLFGVKNFTVVNYDLIVRGNTPYAKQMEFAQDPRYKQNKNDADSAFLLRFNLPPETFIIFDESHKCKAEASSSSELMLAAWQQKYKFLLLSASQATTPKDMFILGRILNQHNFFDYREWMCEFGGSEDGYWNPNIDMNDPIARDRMKELHDDIYNRGVASRMTPDMFGSSFKNNQILPECFDMGENTNNINQIYSDMQQEIKRLQDRGYKDCVLAEIMKARRMAELHKVSTFVDLAVDAYEQGKSVTIFVNFKETLEAIVKRIGKRVGEKLISKVCGGQTELERDTEIENFQADKARFIVCNIAAGGVGISLHDLNGNFPRISLLSPTFSAVAFLQATGRIYREGSLTDCVQYVVYCAGSIEEDVCYKLKGKLGALDILNDGDLSLTGYGLDVEWNVEDDEEDTETDDIDYGIYKENFA